MNKRLSSIYIALLAILILTSCSKNVLVKNGKSVIQETKFEYFSSKTKMKMDESGKTISFITNFRIKHDEIIWGNVSKAGFSVARFKITQDSLLFLDKYNKEYYAYDYKAINQMLGIEINYKTVEAFLMNNLIIAPTKNDKAIKTDSSFAFIAKSYPFIIMNHIHPSIKRINGIEIKNELVPQNTINVEYRDFKAIKKQNFPFKTIIVAEGLDEQEDLRTFEIELDHSKVEFTSEELSFPFTVSSKYVKKN